MIPTSSRHNPELIILPDDPEKLAKQFRRLRRCWLPGSALVLRDDLLHANFTRLQAAEPSSTIIDAWLDLCRLNTHAAKIHDGIEVTGEDFDAVEWRRTGPDGWLVPIPVGYAALTPLHASSDIKNVRDTSTPFRFVESIYSIGQWIGAHHLDNVQQMLWYGSNQEPGIYRCKNDFTQYVHSFHD